MLPGPPSPIPTHAADAPSMADASPLDQGPAIKSSPATTKKEVSKKGAGKGDSVKSSKGKNNRKEGGGDDTAQSAGACRHRQMGGLRQSERFLKCECFVSRINSQPKILEQNPQRACPKPFPKPFWDG